MSDDIIVSKETEALLLSIEDRLERGEFVPAEDFERFLCAVYGPDYDSSVPMPESSLGSVDRPRGFEFALPRRSN
jgi:hypothetical protein